LRWVDKKTIVRTDRLDIDSKQHHTLRYEGAICLVHSKRQLNTDLNSTSQCVWPNARVRWFALGGQEKYVRTNRLHRALRRCSVLIPNFKDILPTEPRGQQEDFLATRYALKRTRNTASKKHMFRVQRHELYVNAFNAERLAKAAIAHLEDRTRPDVSC